MASLPGLRLHLDSCTHTTRLTRDGTLALIVDNDLQDFVAAWIPRHLTLEAGVPTNASSQRPEFGAVIRVRRTTAVADSGQSPRERTSGAPVVATFGPVSMRPIADGLALEVSNASTRGVVDYPSLSANLEVDPTAPSEVLGAHAMLTIAAAALLGRMGRALVHAAAIVAPDGGAWLLAGDTHAGKSTTCATLLDAGWRYCSDDHVVVSPNPIDEVHVEGWPRILHLDRGWDDGTPHGGLRASVNTFERWPGYWQPSARLMGVLLPTVHPHETTRLLPCTAAARLTALIRQSPWLFADPTAAPVVLALLRRIALLPGAALRLGSDSFHKAPRLQEALAPLIAMRAERTVNSERVSNEGASEHQAIG